MNPDMASGNSLDPDILMASDGRGGRSVHPSPHNGVTLRFPHSFQWYPRPRTCALPLVITQATDIDSDPHCNGLMCDGEMERRRSQGVHTLWRMEELETAVRNKQL